jgi:23S rRNA (guanine745-N1)-methyltransferase
MTSAFEHSLDVLACPLCGAGFSPVGTSLRCDDGHVFDISRFGYASLTTGGGPHFSGDTAAMVAARDAYLGEGHYQPIAEAIAVDAPQHGWCVELAGGTGYYAAQVLDASNGLSGITIDVSKHAARTAARTHPRLASVTGDVTARLPIHSGSASVILSVFGPRRGDEVARILAPGGTVVVVTPRANHLIELRERFSLLAIGADKEARLVAAMQSLTLTGTTELEYEVQLTPADMVNSIMMGPNAFHRDAAEVAALAAALPAGQRTTISVTVSRFGA